jgi:transcriptional regulator with XRE-family HTH domain
MTHLYAPITNAICEQLRQGRTQREIGEELDLSRRTIGAIVCGKRNIGRRTLGAICDARPPWLSHILAQPLLEPEGAPNGAGDHA